MKRLVTLLLLVCGCIRGQAQLLTDPTTNNITDVKSSINITPKTLLYIDSTASFTAGEVLAKPFFQLNNFKLRKSIPAGMIHFSYYLKFSMSNDTDSSQIFFLYPGSLFDKIILYKTGLITEAIIDTGNPDGYKKISLLPHQQATILACLKPVKIENVSINPQLIRADFLENFKLAMLNTRSEIKNFGFVMSGVLLMMILFMGTNFILSKRNCLGTQPALL